MKLFILVKLDFEKGCDCLDWNFLVFVMEQMGFGERWRKWIFECISTVRVSVLVNGSPTIEFPNKRGIPQGDPLTPFFVYLSGGNIAFDAG